MKSSRGLFLAIIVIETLAITYLLYSRIASPGFSGIGRQVTDSLKKFNQTDSMQDAGLISDYLKTSTINFSRLNLEAIYGECRTAGSFGGNIPPDYLQIEVTVKGNTSLRVPQYILDGKDYASHPGCFQTKPDSKTMSNFIPYNRSDSILPFLINFRTSDTRDNPFEYSVVVKDNKGKQIAKFPMAEEGLKGKVPFISSSVLINDTIQLKQVK